MRTLLALETNMFLFHKQFLEATLKMTEYIIHQYQSKILAELNPSNFFLIVYI